MILQQKLSAKKYALPGGVGAKVTPSLTVPGIGFNLALAMEQYKRGTLVERVKGFYEKEGFETPEFDKMTKLDQLYELAKYRKMRKEAANNLEAAYAKANQKQQANEVLEQKKKAEKPGRSTDSGEGTKPSGKNDGD